MGNIHSDKAKDSGRSDVSNPAKKSALKRLIPLGVIAVALALFFAFDGPKYISLESLRTNRDVLSAFVQDNLILTLFGFFALYALLVGISVPGAGFLSIFGGFLFGTWLGGAVIVLGATVGATAIFLATRYAIGDMLSQRAGPYLKKFEAGLKENELSYMFILRLIPVFPFFVVNFVPALFDVKLRNYFIATLFGIIPGSLVYASVGTGIGAVFDAGEDVKLSGLMTQPKILAPITGLILLSLIPVVYKKFKKPTHPSTEISS